MIEVEKKFKPTEEQFEHLINEAVSLGVTINHDIYYDYSDLRYFKGNMRLRNRNGVFELKIGKSGVVSEEIEDVKEIERILDITDGLENYIKEKLIVIMDYTTERQKYLKEGFNIDVDKTSFGYNLCEIELTLDEKEGKKVPEKEIEEAENKILNFALKYNLELMKLSFMKLFKRVNIRAK
jgi:hypothetical protein